MRKNATNPDEILKVRAEGDASVLGMLLRMQEGSLKESGLEPETFMLVHIAALTALDAAPASWMRNLKIGEEAGLAPNLVVGTLIAVAPEVGTACIVSAVSSIVLALGIVDTLARDADSGAGNCHPCSPLQ
jgi:4-carboxymuconolactone decarboxylase